MSLIITNAHARTRLLTFLEDYPDEPLVLRREICAADLVADFEHANNAAVGINHGYTHTVPQPVVLNLVLFHFVCRDTSWLCYPFVLICNKGLELSLVAEKHCATTLAYGPGNAVITGNAEVAKLLHPA